jgi:hypothetical protein
VIKAKNVIRLGAAGLTVGTTMLAAVDTASATYHSVNTARNDHVLSGEGYEHEISGGREQWSDFALSETPATADPRFKVCDYQGQWEVKNPDGSHGANYSSSYHSGCSLIGWFNESRLNGAYAENKRFTAKWRSDYTNNEFKVIGTLVD